ncbi:electron transfer flavoprotein subunit alpha/FixB family protein [Thauera sp. GDN1]|uniref:electron transfer flavoprotein subunit alpha/FixB family protein n=1 Tax=Thauera sp. GDN1 TaxID=2944810 RepID=UPI002478F83F|nr:electron transfer flavoprotein subunit alpha/FixB family protein [Thauera sp. GDN1]
MDMKQGADVMTVVLFSWGDRIEGGAVEALTLAAEVAAALGVEVRWVVTPALEQEAASAAALHGVQQLDVIAAAPGSTDERVSVIAGYCKAQLPRLMLFNQTVEGRVVAARVAGRLGLPVLANVVSLAPDSDALRAEASAYGGDTRAEYLLKAPRNVVSVVTTAVVARKVDPAVQVETRRVEVEPVGGGAAFEVISAPQVQGQRLEDAEIIVSGGRGLGKRENFEFVKEMADALGGMWGGSRAIVDDGWIDSSRQVGLTGKITRPGLYIALGISGASQHMAGCSAAKTIIAINTDPDASIFRYARYGVVGDCVELLPELIRAAKA